MSGSGGGGNRITSRGGDLPSGRPKHGSKGGQNGGASGDPCDITEVTTLNSPDRTVLATLRDGNILDIELQEGRRLLAKHGSNVAGSVTSASHARILQCMRNGRKYEAVVRSIRSGSCVVRIRPK